MLGGSQCVVRLAASAPTVVKVRGVIIRILVYSDGVVVLLPEGVVALLPEGFTDVASGPTVLPSTFG